MSWRRGFTPVPDPDYAIEMSPAEAWELLRSLRGGLRVEQWRVNHATVIALLDLDERLRKP